MSNITHFDNSDSVWNERKNVLFEVNSSFLDVSEQFSFHVSNISDCLSSTDQGFAIVYRYS